MKIVSNDQIEILVYYLIKEYVPIGKIDLFVEEIKRVKGKNVVLTNEVVGKIVKDIFNEIKSN